MVSSYYAIKNKKENKILIENYKLLREEYEIYQSEILQIYRRNDINSTDDSVTINSILNTNITVDDIALTSINNEIVQLSDILDNEKLIFRFNQSKACGPCIERVISILKELGELIGNDRIILIGKFEYLKYLMLFKEVHLFEFQVYNYNNRWLKDYEGSKFSYEQVAGLLNKDLSLRMIYKPTELDSITDSYYQKVLKEFK